MGEFSLTHLLLLAVIFLIFFGPSRLPQLGQSLGKAIRGFKQGLNEIDVDSKDIKDNRNDSRPSAVAAEKIENQTTPTSFQQKSEVEKQKQHQDS